MIYDAFFSVMDPVRGGSLQETSASDRFFVPYSSTAKKNLQRQFPQTSVNLWEIFVQSFRVLGGREDSAPPLLLWDDFEKRNAKNKIGRLLEKFADLVRAWGLGPQRITAREPKGNVTSVKGLDLYTQDMINPDTESTLLFSLSFYLNMCKGGRKSGRL